MTADTAAAVAGGSVGEVAPTAVEENTSLLNNCNSTSAKENKKMPPTPDEAEANSPAATSAEADAASETTPLAGATADGVDPVKVRQNSIYTRRLTSISNTYTGVQASSF